MADGCHIGHRARMKKDFLENGFPDSTPQHKILEMLLFFCLPQGDTNPLAHQLIERYRTIGGVLDAPVEELVKFKGITESNVVLLKMILPIARLYRDEQHKRGFGFKNPEEIGKFLLDRYLGETRERFSVLSMDGMAQLISFDFLSEGDISSVGVSSRQVIELILKTGATCVIVAHNHPGGIALPSSGDIAVTKMLKVALKHIGVHLIDHIIIAGDDYVSLNQSEQYADIFE